MQAPSALSAIARIFTTRSIAMRHLLASLLLAWTAGLVAAEPLKIGYSDYPSFVAWEVAVQKGWFKEAGVDVEFVWFEYAPSLDAFTTGKIDGLNIAASDQLVMAGASKKSSKAILITDYTDGNDQVIAKPGIATMKDLKGKKVGVEVGLVDHLLLLEALKASGMTIEDIELVNVVTTDTPQALASGQVDAVACWQPSVNQTFKQVPGAKALFTSKQLPGLIYDVVVVTDESLAKRRDDWKKVVAVWPKVLAFIADPKTHDEAIAIMAARNGVDPKEYALIFPGSKLQSLTDNQAAFALGKSGPGTLFGAHIIADTFNRSQKIYADALKVETLIDGSIVAGLAK
jgi:NitT/TauT family transport system substrate-binding protein